jgi:hypothetical protein
MGTPDGKRPPLHPLAAGSFAAALVAFVLAWYGGLYGEKHTAGSPLNAARLAPSAPMARPAESGGWLVPLVGYVAPLLLGVGSAFAGGRAMRVVEDSNGAYRGDLPAVFAVMLGGLSAVTGGVMLVAVYGWRFVPAW